MDFFTLVSLVRIFLVDFLTLVLPPTSLFPCSSPFKGTSEWSGLVEIFKENELCIVGGGFSFYTRYWIFINFVY